MREDLAAFAGSGDAGEGPGAVVEQLPADVHEVHEGDAEGRNRGASVDLGLVAAGGGHAGRDRVVVVLSPKKRSALL